MSRQGSGRLSSPPRPLRSVSSGSTARPGGATTPSSEPSPSKAKQQSVPEDSPVLEQSLVPDFPELRALLTDHPESFNVSAFIEKLTKPLLDPGALKPGKAMKPSDFGFDSVALHELFSTTLERLSKLGKEVDEKIAAMEDDNNKIATQRKKEIERHHRSLQGVHETIEEIETHFRKVGLTAVRIGQSLSQTETQRQKAEHAQSLLEFFLAFNDLRYDVMLKDAESEKIEMLSHEVLNILADERNYKFAATILSDLLVVCEDLNAPQLENAVRNIRVFAERLEKRLLDRFEAAAMAESGTPDVSTMRDCAVSILQFGDAVKLYNTYIYTIMAKHIKVEKGGGAGGGGDAAEEMRDMLSEFFGTVSEQCQKAFALIRQIFPPSAALKVTRMLIDRMVNDPAFGIHVKVAEVLNPSDKDSLSVPDSLDLLLMVHEKTNALATVLIDHCVEAEQRFLKEGGSATHPDDETGEEESAEVATATNNSQEGKRAAGKSSRSQEALSSFVKAQFAELFIEQRQSYPEKELSLLRMRLTDALARNAGDVGLNVPIEKKVKRTGGRARQLQQQQQADQSWAATMPPLRIDRIDAYETITHNWLRKEVLNGFLDSCREAISRNAAMFRKDEERADNVLEILIVLHAFLATSVLLPTLSAASNIVQNPVNGPPPKGFYEVMEGVHAWVSSFKDFFKSTALPEVVKAKDNTPQTVLLTSCRNFLERVERAGAKTVEKGLDAVLRHMERLHREMITKTDYMPKDPILELQPTRACVMMKEVLVQQLEYIHKHMPHKDVRPITSSLALRLQELMCSRIKLLRINTSGALVLMQDVEILYELFNRSESPEVKDAFDELKEIVGLFIVPPEKLKDIIDNGHWQSTEKREVYYYISLRADYRIHGMRSPWVRHLLEDAPEDFDDEAPPPPSGSLPSRQGSAKHPQPKTYAGPYK